ncbi:MAG: DUF2752 domain-containing protein [Bacteroides sp.]
MRQLTMKKRDSWQERLAYVVKCCGVLLVCGLAYAAFYIKTGYGIPCRFHEITGLSCPGCGISRMFVNMFRMQWHEAFMNNPAVFVLLPFMMAYVLRRLVIYVKSGMYRENAFTRCFIGAVLVILIIFGVVRNIIGI